MQPFRSNRALGVPIHDHTKQLDLVLHIPHLCGVYIEERLLQLAHSLLKDLVMLLFGTSVYDDVVEVNVAFVVELLLKHRAHYSLEYDRQILETPRHASPLTTPVFDLAFNARASFCVILVK